MRPAPIMPERVRISRLEALAERRRHVATRAELRHAQQERDRLARAIVTPRPGPWWARAWRWLVGGL